MAQEKCLWKKVTLEEDHNADGIGNPVYWGDFLGITNQNDLGTNVYVAVFLDNNPNNQSYQANLISYTSVSGEIVSCNIRNNWSSSNAIYTTGRSLHASKGATVLIYKLSQ